jgi:hypothetical protein
VSGRSEGQTQASKFEDFVVLSANEALEKTFDSSTAKAVQFYIDARILVRNPDAYAESMLKMFGKEGGKVVLNSIMKTLLQKTGMPEEPQRFPSLRDCVNAVAKQYRSG